MKIVKSLKIEISQADVEEAIIRMIREEDPTIVVDKIEFTSKRKGSDSISVDVDAHFSDETPAPVVEKVAVEVEPETPLNRDGTLDVDLSASGIEEQEMSLIDEVLAEEANDDEAPFDTTPEPTEAASIADLLK